jgi:hypothetical protein
MQRQADAAKGVGIQFNSRYRSLTFKTPERAPIEQLAEVHTDPRRRSLVNIDATTASLMFDLPTVVVARSASVTDITDPMRRLPSAGLKLFRVRLEESYGNRIDMNYSRGAGAPIAECFWGTGSRPAVITGGIFMDTGAQLLAHCTPRVWDIEIELGFWTVEMRGGHYSSNRDWRTLS